MSLKEFDKLFGLKTSIEEEKVKFVNRIENVLFDDFLDKHNFQHYKQLYIAVCNQLGLNSTKIINDNSVFGYENIPSFSCISEHDFIKTLRVLVAIYSSIKDQGLLELLSNYIQSIIDKSTIDLGIKWKDGLFYPSGDKLLDHELIDTSLELLTPFPNEQKDIIKALDNYSAKSLYGVVENCYLALEGLSRKLLNNNKTLIDNRPELIKTLEFSIYWNKIFANYLNYANEYRRHAGENRHDLKSTEIEAFLYLTCLMVRAMIRTFNEKK